MAEEETPKAPLPPKQAPFLVVKCPDCSSEQVVFSRPSAKVSCVICGSLLVSPTGGKGKFRSEILREAA
jgi:small subunit ribosomal protein S27e